MSNNTMPSNANTFGRNADDRTWSLAGLQPQRDTGRRTTSRRRRQSAPDEPSLPFWEFIYPEQ